jgi:hypothetical protein
MQNGREKLSTSTGSKNFLQKKIKVLVQNQPQKSSAPFRPFLINLRIIRPQIFPAPQIFFRVLCFAALISAPCQHLLFFSGANLLICKFTVNFRVRIVTCLYRYTIVM